MYMVAINEPVSFRNSTGEAHAQFWRFERGCGPT
jgi:hypothetical protein